MDKDINYKFTSKKYSELLFQDGFNDKHIAWWSFSENENTWNLMNGFDNNINNSSKTIPAYSYEQLKDYINLYDSPRFYEGNWFFGDDVIEDKGIKEENIVDACAYIILNKRKEKK